MAARRGTERTDGGGPAAPRRSMTIVRAGRGQVAGMSSGAGGRDAPARTFRHGSLANAIRLP
ncbi:hypothetical protein FRAAL1405 [Frankia alni ACN14a]|uniref:Uncharacterized protein n=1 Tax=Frankia alni (strain DSM 45986 / CECT 9034 / ACN14a) TaxID=326424 RepID=Q0RQV9_FRAAA|nr:hypothetical protein FRAAL1405 [Frankia alni ACN14a]